MGGRYNFDFTEEVTVLITRDNKSEKYIMAREQAKIYTVTSKWLKDSTEKDYFLKPEDYTFPIFYDKIFCFYNCETKELTNKVRKHRADVRSDIEAWFASKLTIVIPNNDIWGYVKELKREYSFFTKYFNDKTLKLVTIPWIDAFINSEREMKKYMVNPEKYKDTEVPLISPLSKHPDKLSENRRINNEETK